MIAGERRRQMEAEGHSLESDVRLNPIGQLVHAAICYASVEEPVYVQRQIGAAVLFADPWPWDADGDKREEHVKIRRLVIAGALLAAEIDRLLLIDGCLPKEEKKKAARPDISWRKRVLNEVRNWVVVLAKKKNDSVSGIQAIEVCEGMLAQIRKKESEL